MQWRRYRFYTASVEDPRPLIFNPKFPWWVSGYEMRPGGQDYNAAVIIAYLPADEPLAKYWDDADEVEYTNEEAITFSSRFPKPAYFQE